jgi:rhodanese-related sulfurtransferase
VARFLISKGYLKVYALQGGWMAWQKAGYPVEKK